ncbi:MAG: hypothetical protein KC917_07830 [Candidatus Omnitrophica bacterium]|nr:hypothetical protein [Candidatus Omnitrophota bacterium]
MKPETKRESIIVAIIAAILIGDLVLFAHRAMNIRIENGAVTFPQPPWVLLLFCCYGVYFIIRNTQKLSYSCRRSGWMLVVFCYLLIIYFVGVVIVFSDLIVSWIFGVEFFNFDLDNVISFYGKFLLVQHSFCKLRVRVPAQGAEEAL